MKPDRVEALQRLIASYGDLAVPGFVGTHVYRTDADANRNGARSEIRSGMRTLVRSSRASDPPCRLHCQDWAVIADRTASRAYRLTITVSRYSLGTTMLPSSARLKREMRSSRSVSSAARPAVPTASKLFIVGP